MTERILILAANHIAPNPTITTFAEARDAVEKWRANWAGAVDSPDATDEERAWWRANIADCNVWLAEAKKVDEQNDEEARAARIKEMFAYVAGAPRATMQQGPMPESGRNKLKAMAFSLQSWAEVARHGAPSNAKSPTERAIAASLADLVEQVASDIEAVLNAPMPEPCPGCLTIARVYMVEVLSAIDDDSKTWHKRRVIEWQKRSLTCAGKSGDNAAHDGAIDAAPTLASYLRQLSPEERERHVEDLGFSGKVGQ